MTVTFTWDISQLECAPTENELTNVIKTIHWRYKGQDAEGFAAESYGSIGLKEPDPIAFTKYEDITKETVISWLESNLNVIEDGEELSTLQKSLIQNIELQRNPPIVNLGLPWDKVSVDIPTT
jgi:hypothetical protein